MAHNPHNHHIAHAAPPDAPFVFTRYPHPPPSAPTATAPLSSSSYSAEFPAPPHPNCFFPPPPTQSVLAAPSHHPMMLQPAPHVHHHAYHHHPALHQGPATGATYQTASPAQVPTTFVLDAGTRHDGVGDGSAVAPAWFAPWGAPGGPWLLAGNAAAGATYPAHGSLPMSAPLLLAPSAPIILDPRMLQVLGHHHHHQPSAHPGPPPAALRHHDASAPPFTGTGPTPSRWQQQPQQSATAGYGMGYHDMTAESEASGRRPNAIGSHRGASETPRQPTWPPPVRPVPAVRDPEAKFNLLRAMNARAAKEDSSFDAAGTFAAMLHAFAAPGPTDVVPPLPGCHKGNASSRTSMHYELEVENDAGVYVTVLYGFVRNGAYQRWARWIADSFAGRSPTRSAAFDDLVKCRGRFTIPMVDALLLCGDPSDVAAGEAVVQQFAQRVCEIATTERQGRQAITRLINATHHNTKCITALVQGLSRNAEALVRDKCATFVMKHAVEALQPPQRAPELMQPIQQLPSCLLVDRSELNDDLSALLLKLVAGVPGQFSDHDAAKDVEGAEDATRHDRIRVPHWALRSAYVTDLPTFFDLTYNNDRCDPGVWSQFQDAVYSVLLHRITEICQNGQRSQVLWQVLLRWDLHSSSLGQQLLLSLVASESSTDPCCASLLCRLTVGRCAVVAALEKQLAAEHCDSAIKAAWKAALLRFAIVHQESGAPAVTLPPLSKEMRLVHRDGMEAASRLDAVVATFVGITTNA